jgi:hypothetical protein
MPQLANEPIRIIVKKMARVQKKPLCLLTNKMEFMGNNNKQGNKLDSRPPVIKALETMPTRLMPTYKLPSQFSGILLYFSKKGSRGNINVLQAIPKKTWGML